MKLWNVATGKAQGSFEGDKAGIEAVELSKDGKTLAVRGKGHTVTLHDVAKILGDGR